MINRQISGKNGPNVVINAIFIYMYKIYNAQNFRKIIHI